MYECSNLIIVSELCVLFTLHILFHQKYKYLLYFSRLFSPGIYLLFNICRNLEKISMYTYLKNPKGEHKHFV